MPKQKVFKSNYNTAFTLNNIVRLLKYIIMDVFFCVILVVLIWGKFVLV